jgi:hypothetical protein
MLQRVNDDEDYSLLGYSPVYFVELDQGFRGVYYLHHHPDDGGSTHLINVDLLQQDYTVLYPRKL